MPFTIERNDLAVMEVDAVVVPANEQLLITGGAGAVVADAAGFEQMREACAEIGYCATGDAVVTPGFGLAARWVVHAVGPIWEDDGEDRRPLLKSAYDSALARASEQGAESVALPLLSAGSFGFPPEVSFSEAMDATRRFLDSHDDVDVHLVLYDQAAVRAGLALYGDIASYISDAFVEEQHRLYSNRSEFCASGAAPQPPYNPEFRSYEMPREPRHAVPPRASGSYEAARSYGAPDSGRKAARKQNRGGVRGALGRLGDAVSERLSDLRERGKESSAQLSDEASVEECANETVGEYVCGGAPYDAPSMAPQVSPTVPMAGLEDYGVVRIDQEYQQAKEQTGSFEPVLPAGSADAGLDGWLAALDTPFSTMLLTLIDARGLTDAEVYKRANMSRQLFSKIRSDAQYRPTKKTVLALAVALELDLSETADLLRRAGFALSHSNVADVIVEYFIVHGVYDIFAINEALYAFDQPLL